MKTYTKTYTNEQIKQLKEKYKKYIVDKQINYVQFQIKLEDCTITVYTSNKVVFQGNDLSLFIEDSFIEQAGSDEVGTGDYFGPVVVCACYVSQENQALLEKHHVTDSKQLTDEMIRQHAPFLMEKLPHSILILDNLKYNQVHESNNMNAIKAKLHNQAYVHLKKKIHQLPSLCIVDQFTPENLYYRYIQHEKEIVSSLHFETKAESKYPSVAAASMIARYTFLKCMDVLEKKYEMEIPKGAGENVDQFIGEFVSKYGYDELRKIAKLHFKNTQKAGYYYY